MELKESLILPDNLEKECLVYLIALTRKRRNNLLIVGLFL